jgi:hypothetical protein
MTKSKRGFVVVAILTAAISAASVSAFAKGTCSSDISSCIKNAAGKTDAAEKCKAAGAECMKTGVFVAPYSGTLFPADKK